MSSSLVLITGITGHVGFKILVTALQAGYTVRGAIRREAQIDSIKSKASVQPFLDRLSFAVVSDITVDGAFDAALKGVTYVVHVASPLPAPNADPENDIIRPAVQGTLSILHSAAKVPSIRRIVITSSAVAIVPDEKLAKGDTITVYTAQTRAPLPSGPYKSAPQAYRAAKALALDAAEKFLTESKPTFSIVHIMPSYVFGANSLATDAKSVATGSNAILMGLVLGMKAQAATGTVVHLDDVARIHVGALDETKVPASTSFLVSSSVQFEDALEMAKRLFPEAVKEGQLPLGGSRATLPMMTDVQETVDVFGPLKGYEEMVESVVGQYLDLLGGLR